VRNFPWTAAIAGSAVAQQPIANSSAHFLHPFDLIL
jgi:hypothetical protein